MSAISATQIPETIAINKSMVGAYVATLPLDAIMEKLIKEEFSV